jgi:formate transporter
MNEVNRFSMDALLPAEMAVKAEAAGVKKVNMDITNVFVLALLAGAFIALGAVFSNTVAAGTAGTVPYGVARLLIGVTFSLGLILVIVGGAELFTGNNLIVMAWANRKVTTFLLLRNWLIVYFGNFVGAVATAILAFLSGQYTSGNGTVGASALNTANVKVQLDFGEALVLGVLCNGLVCLAVWLTYSCRSTSDKILALVPPITAFVAAGFEHSIANMYFIPFGLFIKAGAPESFWAKIGKTPGDFADLTWGGFAHNLLPVTLGNVLGGAVLVGAVYWFVYLRGRKSDQPPVPPTAA